MKIEFDFILAKTVLLNKPVVSGVKAQHAITKSDSPSKSSSDTARIRIQTNLRMLSMNLFQFPSVESWFLSCKVCVLITWIYFITSFPAFPFVPEEDMFISPQKVNFSVMSLLSFRGFVPVSISQFFCSIGKFVQVCFKYKVVFTTSPSTFFLSMWFTLLFPTLSWHTLFLSLYLWKTYNFISSSQNILQVTFSNPCNKRLQKE